MRQFNPRFGFLLLTRERLRAYTSSKEAIDASRRERGKEARGAGRNEAVARRKVIRGCAVFAFSQNRLFSVV